MKRSLALSLTVLICIPLLLFIFYSGARILEYSENVSMYITAGITPIFMTIIIFTLNQQYDEDDTNARQ